ncbi:zinc-type alcohol dehydrogenase-like protein SERP1785 [Maniola hyperantus]|uniref:zinc-type alcohol dehydrogenase-like protein SERP1785 n=1 Tax=Aphantopus hyperantus TaxID=2795564 RepID=UPI0015684070|nr:zinc-type alcohol dehydrogenase-like protein SERP1785 [Maniola hyperantus]
MFRRLSVIACFVSITIVSVCDNTSALQENSSTMAKYLPRTMRAVGLYKYLPISDPSSLLDLEVALPTMQKNDVLVEVKATSVNPIDTKQRAPKPTIETTPRILGFDGAGVVVAKGDASKIFKIGDEVFFTGDFRRSGSNAQYVALDEVLVGPKPKNLSFEQAAAMPLTGVTAYESLYDRLLLSKKDAGKSLLIINSAGGVGSVASQLAKNLGLNVIGTASRKETQEFSLAHGADIVLNHTKDLIPQLEANGYGNGVDYILVNYDPYPYWDTMMQVIKPQGKICLIVDSSGLVDLKPLKTKSLTVTSEMMLTRIIYNTDDKYKHHEILQEISKMLENGQLKTTLTKIMSPINAANMKEAHRLLEDKHMIGKIVVTNFEEKEKI